jgi:hypothetical protein
MNVKSQNSPKPWVDPDDAPELTQDFFEQGEWKIGERFPWPIRLGTTW